MGLIVWGRSTVEYFRQPNNKIQAGFALNAGNLLMQYRKMAKSLPEDSRYEATLAICVYQSLLTHCSELLASMSKHSKNVWSMPLPDNSERWGIKREFVKSNTFPGPLTYERFINHVRNALSHPTMPDKDPKLPCTGYTTIPGTSGTVEAFQFIDSPWVVRGSDHSQYKSKNPAKVVAAINKFNKKYECHLEVTPNAMGDYQAFKDGQPYRPVFITEIPLNSLTQIALELSNMLAQPAQENWDGETLHQLVA